MSSPDTYVRHNCSSIIKSSEKLHRNHAGTWHENFWTFFVQVHVGTSSNSCCCAIAVGVQIASFYCSRFEQTDHGCVTKDANLQRTFAVGNAENLKFGANRHCVCLVYFFANHKWLHPCFDAWWRDSRESVRVIRANRKFE